ncbi:MAG: phospho-sugar mutase [Firmicutes bacterium]|nr:phospho-sugar mutase [Bacillota bacterium]
MDYRETYQLWKNDPYFDEEDRKELASLTDEKEIEDRFYKELEFGTGGLRGIMGVGSNRINKYNVRKASNGFARYLIDKYGTEVWRGVAVAYDTRNNSAEYAKETALAFAANGIPVYLFTFESATPLLSFAVRYYHCVGGVVVTASHNPKEYNGYKAYDENGCQLLTEDADAVIAKVNAIKVTEAMTTTEDKAVSVGLLKYIGEEVLQAYSRAVRDAVPEMNITDNAKMKIAYTALHGSGNVTVRRVLKDAGFANVQCVKEQEAPDGNFPTVKSPNPGNEPSMAMVIELGEKIGADIAVGSDPDADRAGVAIRHHGTLEFLDGNSIGALILYYLAERYQGKMPAGPFFVTTIVSGELASDIAKKNDIIVFKTLTGFKYIGELMTRYQDDPNMNFLFGCEESYGFLAGDYVRDKCAAFAILTLCSACAYYQKQGMELGDVMDRIHEEYGFYLDSLDNYVFKGKEGAEKMKGLTAELREKGAALMTGVSEIKDYAPGLDGLPKADVLKYFFEDGSWVAIRPSGTEPQIKVYYSTKAETKEAAEKKYLERKAIIDKVME